MLHETFHQCKKQSARNSASSGEAQTKLGSKAWKTGTGFAYKLCNEYAQLLKSNVVHVYRPCANTDTTLRNSRDQKVLRKPGHKIERD